MQFTSQQDVLDWMRVSGVRVNYNSMETIMEGNRYQFVANDLHDLLKALQKIESEKLTLIKALQNIESFSALSAPGTILEQINVFASKALFDVGELEEKEQCGVCGDHDCAGGLPCETGDGV